MDNYGPAESKFNELHKLNLDNFCVNAIQDGLQKTI